MQQFTGKQYLQIDIANSFGLDKKTWQERLDWFTANEAQLETIADQAEEPAQYVAGVMAYRTMQRKQPTGHLCGLDATASGLQLLSLLAGCPKSASMCNLIDTGQREDAYTKAYEAVITKVTALTNLPRKAVKQALMTHLYGSKKVPREVFGEDTPALRAFYEVIDELLPGADMLNRDLLSLWQPDALAHCWTVPDGFDVVVKVMAPEEHTVTVLGTPFVVREYVNKPQAEGLSLGANIIHSIDGMVVREMGRRCMYDPAKVAHAEELLSCGGAGTSTLRRKDLELLRVLELARSTGFYSMVLLEHLDESNIGHLALSDRMWLRDTLDTLPKKPFSLLVIHDCFKFHANYGNDVRQQYLNILMELADSDVVANIATQIKGEPVVVNKIDPDLAARMRTAEYALS